MTEAKINPKLILAAADTAIRHAKEPASNKKAVYPGKKIQSKGFSLFEAFHKFVKSLMSNGKRGKSALSLSLFIGSALLVSASIVWPVVGLGIAFLVGLAGLAIIAAGTLIKA